MAEEKNTYYDLTINCTLDNQDLTLYFDYVESNKVTLESEITTHPLVTGDMISDHQYINPASESFSGTFSLYGNKKTYQVIIGEDVISESYGDSVSNRLLYIENLFEQIQKEGIHCSIVKKSNNGDTSRFKVRNNMILTSITWTENQFSVDFDFNFNEALLADVPDEEAYNVDYLADPDLPQIEELHQKQLSDEGLIDENEIVKTIINILQNEELLDEAFLNNLSDTMKYIGSAALITSAVAATAAISTATLIASIAGSLAAAAPVGTIIVAIAGIVAGFASIVYFTIRAFKRKAKYNIKAFKTYRKQDKNEEEQKRFVDFIDNTMSQFKTLDEHLLLFQFEVNENQQCFITIDDVLYVITATRNSLNDIYNITIQGMDSNGNMYDEVSCKNMLGISVGSLFDCNDDTKLFSTKNNTQVYLLNLAEAKNFDGSKEITFAETGDLRNYALLISTIDMNQFKDVISDIIKTNIFKE